ncbi:MAG TPA: hypothetical protein PLQ52_10935 [Lacunisphaera sp.]|jgi:hypothetical protein|nr:hypothetical protein [Lacunisphaera sp.]
MKPIAAAVCLLFATSLMQAQSAPATKPADPKAPAAKTAPAKATPGTAKPGAKKEELPKIPGAMITRANGTLLGLEVVGGNFKLTFYDKKHKPMAMDVTRATARWPNPRSPGDNRTVLNGSGTSLVGQKPVIPPYTFNVFLTLLQGEGDEAKSVENYTVQFRG